MEALNVSKGCRLDCFITESSKLHLQNALAFHASAPTYLVTYYPTYLNGVESKAIVKAINFSVVTGAELKKKF